MYVYVWYVEEINMIPVINIIIYETNRKKYLHNKKEMSGACNK